MDSKEDLNYENKAIEKSSSINIIKEQELKRQELQEIENKSINSNNYKKKKLEHNDSFEIKEQNKEKKEEIIEVKEISLKDIIDSNISDDLQLMKIKLRKKNHQKAKLNKKNSYENKYTFIDEKDSDDSIPDINTINNTKKIKKQQRTDAMGRIIQRGKKQHKITFLDKLLDNHKYLVDVEEVESYKKFNKETTFIESQFNDLDDNPRINTTKITSGGGFCKIF